VVHPFPDSTLLFSVSKNQGSTASLRGLTLRWRVSDLAFCAVSLSF
jgi:hypothetical protein